MSVAAVAPEPMQTTCLPRVVEIVGPGLRVHDPALEAVHPRPLRRVALGVPVVALTHPQESGGDHDLARPTVPVAAIVHRRSSLDQVADGDPVPVADVPVEIVVVDDLAHVPDDLVGRWRSVRPSTA